MNPSRIAIAALAFAAAAAGVVARAQDAPKPATKTKNVVLVMSDGLRWQEVFGGADPALINKKDGGVAEVEAVQAAYGQETPEARREALLPFLSKVVAKQGRLYGDVGNECRVTNGKNFSYPGYNEVFTGFGDPRIDSNDKFNNPNVTVFEWLDAKPDFRGKVAAYGTWDVFPYILNRERSGMKIVACWEPPTGEGLTPQEKLLGEINANVHRLWSDCGYDAFSFYAALENLKREKPRVTFIGLGETDEFAHAGRYDHYLTSAHKFDASMKLLWETLQAMPEYKDSTTLILTADHGRGDAPSEWKSHGEKIKGSERIWVGVLGPDTPPKGDATLTTADQNQLAATLAALLGEDYNAYQPKAGPVISSAFGRP
ncbi:alkaline phosphatase family protein [Paludisphaera mucosa]|uniref:Alkaline phosphatase family protein n=1 Tax=Paludisphaera mucosa TaxID=3030827 RepID=A0ABT6FJU6_9BACT|nr:alkaline phosphatase family protein [Paludisphaera mucosa]MDG3007853.1 alkaline phosphatase family protein [Paludisphaera mucosa]